jgi:hypothetical protein
MQEILPALKSNLRQLTFPREFRISAVEWNEDLLQTLHELVAQMNKPPQTHDDPPPKSDDTPSPAQVRFLADVATGLWRLRQRMVDPATGRPPEEMRRAYRHFESVWDALSQAGFFIRDHTGEPVPEGGVYALKAIAYQPTPGLSKEKVIDTVKPSIYYRNGIIQMGEVIVGTPENKE